MADHLRPTAPIFERALLPGDPGRAMALAQDLLAAPRMANHARGLWGYSGAAASGHELARRGQLTGAELARRGQDAGAELGRRLEALERRLAEVEEGLRREADDDDRTEDNSKPENEGEPR